MRALKHHHVRERARSELSFNSTLFRMSITRVVKSEALRSLACRAMGLEVKSKQQGQLCKSEQEIVPIPTHPGFEILKVHAALHFDNVSGLDSIQYTLWRGR